MKKTLLALIIFVLLGTSVFAKETQQIVDEGSKLGQLLVQRIKEGKLTLEDANTTITYGIDYYLEKLRKGDTKSFDNLSLFSLITADLKNYDATLNKPTIASGTIMPLSYTPSDVLFYSTFDLITNLDRTPYSSNKENPGINLVIAPLGSQIYSVRINVRNVTELPQLKMFAKYKDDIRSINPYLIYYTYDNSARVYQPKEKYTSWKDVPSFTGGDVIYIYANINREYSNLSLGLNENETIKLNTLTNFKYSINKVGDEIEKEMGYIPFCMHAILRPLDEIGDVPYYHCKYASMGAFSEGMNSQLFYQYNKTHNYEYENQISSSSVGDMYCKSGASSRSCLWIDDGKITSITDYNR